MLYPELEDLVRLGYQSTRLQMVSNRPVISMASGDQASPFRGKGLEFEEVRQYVHGDDVRNIVLVCVDMNHTMQYGTKVTFKSIQSARAASLIGWAANKSNNRVGGSVFGNARGGMDFFKPTKSRKSLWKILKKLCDHKIYNEEYIPLESHLRYVNQVMQSGSLVFIISDFIHINNNLEKQLRNLHRKADLILISINDISESYLPNIGQLKLTDGKKTLSINTSHIKSSKNYRNRWFENRQSLEQLVKSTGTGLIQLRTDSEVSTELARGMNYLSKKGHYIYGHTSFPAS
jgi:uncharacterized protein (DUF58 family)